MKGEISDGSDKQMRRTDVNLHGQPAFAGMRRQKLATLRYGPVIQMEQQDQVSTRSAQ